MSYESSVPILESFVLNPFLIEHVDGLKTQMIIIDLFVAHILSSPQLID